MQSTIGARPPVERVVANPKALIVRARRMIWVLMTN
jgi:hypothetical protein